MQYNYMTDTHQWGLELTMAAIALNHACNYKKPFTLIDFHNDGSGVSYAQPFNYSIR